MYAALRSLTLTGGDQESPRPEAVVKVMREQDTRVTADPVVAVAP